MKELNVLKEGVELELMIALYDLIELEEGKLKNYSEYQKYYILDFIFNEDIDNLMEVIEIVGICQKNMKRVYLWKILN